MKKIIAIFVLAAGLVSGTVQAQSKFGFIRVDEMVSLMPELKKDRYPAHKLSKRYVAKNV